MATHSNIFAWKIPWTEEPGRQVPWGCKRVGHNLATKQQQENLHTLQPVDPKETIWKWQIFSYRDYHNCIINISK